MEELRAIPNRWDWFSIPFEWGQPFATVPGVVYKDGRFNVHRTHLPLLADHPAVDAFLRLTGADLEPTPERVGVDNAVELRPWQRSGVDWILPRRGVLVADQQRLGKTITALLCHDRSTGPLVIVAPLDTRPVWKRWVMAIFGEELYCFTGKTLDPERVKGKPFLFFHYDILIYHQITGLQPGTLILDEIHVLSNPKSKRTRSIHFYASISKRVIGLSGTPLWNASKGLWGPITAVTPGAWGKLFDFSQRHCSPELTEHGWKYGSVSQRDEWLARRSELVLARTWKMVRPDLPAVQRSIIEIPLDVDGMHEVDLAAAELASEARHLDITVLGRYRQAVGRFKIRAAVERAERVLRRGESVIVWTWHKTIARAIAKLLPGSCILTGDDDGETRANVLEAWNATEAAPIVATLAVGQVGIDMSHAATEIVTEVDWTPAVMSQAEMRPFNANRPTYAEYLVLAHEIDRALLDTVVKKLARGRSFEMAAAESSFEEVADADTLVAHDRDDLLRELGELLLR